MIPIMQYAIGLQFCSTYYCIDLIERGRVTHPQKKVADEKKKGIKNLDHTD